MATQNWYAFEVSIGNHRRGVYACQASSEREAFSRLFAEAERVEGGSSELSLGRPVRLSGSPAPEDGYHIIAKRIIRGALPGPSGLYIDPESADDYFMRDGGYYDFDPAKLGEAHADCLRRFAGAIRVQSRGSDIVVDNTNTTVAELAPYAALALAYGYELEIVILHCEPSVALARNVHNVPERALMGQYCRLLKLKAALPPWWPVTELGLA